MPDQGVIGKMGDSMVRGLRSASEKVFNWTPQRRQATISDVKSMAAQAPNTPAARIANETAAYHQGKLDAAKQAPSKKKGGRIPKTGLYRLHKGETVVPSALKTMKKALEKH